MEQVEATDVRSGTDSYKVFDKYKILPPRGIRLLELLPPKLASKKLRCNIIEAQLDSGISYEAISYCWGTNKPTCQITIANHEDHVFEITDSLAAAFQKFRHKNQSRLLWVDFLGINQKDKNEKSAQVALMTEIYQQASQVLAWTGEDSKEDAAAFQIEQHLDTKPTQSYTDAWASFFALGKLFERPWFGRIWIVQELAIAKKLTLHCTSYEMDWDVFRQGVEFLLNRFGLYLNTTRTDIGIERIVTMLSIRNIVTDHLQLQNTNLEIQSLHVDRLDESREHKQLELGDFFRFVSRCRSFGATDHRDRIYGLRGLVPKVERGDAPDYANTTTPQLFANFARLTINQLNSLDVLTQAGIHDFNLPSWTADWSRRLSARPLEYDRYRASNSVATLDLSTSANILMVKGRKIGSVSNLMAGFLTEVPKQKTNWPNTQEWQPGSAPIDHIEIFEKTASNANDLLQPFTEMLQHRSKIVTSGPKLLGQAASKLYHIPESQKTRTERIKPDLEHTWFELASQSTQYSSREQAYQETLVGGLPLHALGNEMSIRFREACYRIWHERAYENPLVNRGFTSASVWLGKTKSGQPEVELPIELKIAYFNAAGKINSDNFENNRKTQKQTNSSTTTPSLMDRKAYNASQKVSKFAGKLMRSKADESTPAQLPPEPNLTGGPMPTGAEFERRKAYYDSADPWFKANDDREVKQYLARLFSRNLERMAGHRNFGLADGYMGWFPEKTVVGDELWILDGGSVPFVLRPVKEVNERTQYALIGEAYVHGLMHGEYFKKDCGSSLALELV